VRSCGPAPAQPRVSRYRLLGSRRARTPFYRPPVLPPPSSVETLIVVAITSLRTWHRRLSAVVGVQLLLWTLSGLIFTWMPMDELKSKDQLAPRPSPTLPALSELTSPSQAVAALTATDRLDRLGRSDEDAVAPDQLATNEVALVYRRGRWVWELRSFEGRPLLVDASTGDRMPAVDQDEALRLATARFLPEHTSATVTAVEGPTFEFRGELPAWRVGFDDDEHRAVYVDGLTGELLTVRSDAWRRFDFFWMLHIMDYDERQDFNTPWLQIFAGLGVLTSATGLGLGLLMLRLRKRTRAG